MRYVFDCDECDKIILAEMSLAKFEQIAGRPWCPHGGKNGKKRHKLRQRLTPIPFRMH